ncbi:MAG: zinc ribbon domain-containing protein [Candidatus Aminicenantales bacterium]
MMCDNCQARFDQDGRRMDASYREGLKKCPYCGKTVASEFSFCPYCGRPI